MMWEFAASLEKNYNRLDTLPETDEQGKRRIKSIYPQAKKTKNRKKRAYLEKIKKDRIYDPKAHKDQN